MSLTIPDALPVLSRGGHDSPSEGACYMEYTALLAGEYFSDSPQCVDDALAEVMRQINDAMEDGDRYLLVPYLGRAIGLVVPVGNTYITKERITQLRSLVGRKLSRKFGLRVTEDRVSTVWGERRTWREKVNFYEDLPTWYVGDIEWGHPWNSVIPKVLRRVEAIHVAYEQAMDELGFPRPTEPVYACDLATVVSQIGTPVEV